MIIFSHWLLSCFSLSLLTCGNGNCLHYSVESISLEHNWFTGFVGERILLVSSSSLSFLHTKRSRMYGYRVVSPLQYDICWTPLVDHCHHSIFSFSSFQSLIKLKLQQHVIRVKILLSVLKQVVLVSEQKKMFMVWSSL